MGVLFMIFLYSSICHCHLIVADRASLQLASYLVFDLIMTSFSPMVIVFYCLVTSSQVA